MKVDAFFFENCTCESKAIRKKGWRKTSNYSFNENSVRKRVLAFFCLEKIGCSF